MGDLTHEREGQVGVRVNAARDNIFAFGIYNCRSSRGLYSAIMAVKDDPESTTVLAVSTANDQFSLTASGNVSAFRGNAGVGGQR